MDSDNAFLCGRQVFSTAEPPRFLGCDMGPLELTPESSIACRRRQGKMRSWSLE